MNVVLTRDFIDRHVGNPADPDGPPIAVYRSTTHRGKTVEWREGTVLDMSDASGEKYIARKEARLATEEEIVAAATATAERRAAAAEAAKAAELEKARKLLRDAGELPA